MVKTWKEVSPSGILQIPTKLDGVKLLSPRMVRPAGRASAYRAKAQSFLLMEWESQERRLRLSDGGPESDPLQSSC